MFLDPEDFCANVLIRSLGLISVRPGDEQSVRRCTLTDETLMRLFPGASFLGASSLPAEHSFSHHLSKVLLLSARRRNLPPTPQTSVRSGCVGGGGTETSPPLPSLFYFPLLISSASSGWLEDLPGCVTDRPQRAGTACLSANSPTQLQSP